MMKLKKIILSLILLSSLILTLTACSSFEEPPNIYGTYEDSAITSIEGVEYAIVQDVYIFEDNTMEVVFSFQRDGNWNQQVIWYGTVIPPTTGQDPYTWESERLENPDIEDTITIFLNEDGTKTFTYDQGNITFETQYTYNPALTDGVSIPKISDEVEIE